MVLNEDLKGELKVMNYTQLDQHSLETRFEDLKGELKGVLSRLLGGLVAGLH